MKKEAFYFSHDYMALSDPKLQALTGEHGAVGYGIYWYLIELLHQEESHWLPMKEYVYLAIAKQMLASAEQVEAIVKYCILVCDLFIIQDEKFTSRRVLRNFEERDRISEIRSISGLKGAIAKQNLAIAKQNLAKCGKEKKRKEKEIKENINTFVVPYFLKEIWESYIDMRKSIKHPMTYKAQELALSKLNGLSESPDIQIKIVEQSVMNSWQGLFPLKENQQQSLFNNNTSTDSGFYGK